MSESLADWEKDYARLRSRLEKVGWISEGYVQTGGQEPAALATSGRAR